MNGSEAKLEDAEKLLRKTLSLCPVCNKLIEANVVERNGKVFIEKVCDEHGRFSDVYWADAEYYKRASKFFVEGRGLENPNTNSLLPCPFACGLCSRHRSHTALANIVVTNRCDLRCWYCFFYSERAGYVYEPTLKQIEEMLKLLRKQKPVPCTAIQLTGGEPTLRDDLVEIIKLCKRLGFRHVQVNTNGVRLSRDPELARRIREAGTNTIYLSFDGTTEKTNPKNHREVPKIMENCRKVGLGIVFVPTIINTVNDHEIGNIVRFASKNMDIVRGVNFQPVSLVGSMPRDVEKFRITIPEVLQRLEEQTQGEICKEDFYPIPCVAPISHFVEAIKGRRTYEFTCSPWCGAATYVFKDGDKLVPITRFVDVEGFFEYVRELTREVNSAKRFKFAKKIAALVKLARNLKRFVDTEKQPRGLHLEKLLSHIFLKRGEYRALGAFHHRALFIGMMHFMDQWNYDVARVQRCVIHYVTPDMRVIPFCAFNVLPHLYRDAVQKKYGMPIEEWERKTGRKLADDFCRTISK